MSAPCRIVLLLLVVSVAVANGQAVPKTVREFVAANANTTRCSRCFFLDDDARTLDSCLYNTGHAQIFMHWVTVWKNDILFGQKYFISYPLTDQCFNDVLYDTVDDFPDAGERNNTAYKFDIYKKPIDYDARLRWSTVPMTVFDLSIPASATTVAGEVKSRVYAQSDLISFRLRERVSRLLSYTDPKDARNGVCATSVIIPFKNLVPVTPPASQACAYRQTDSGNRGIVYRNLLDRASHGAEIEWAPATGNVDDWSMGEEASATFDEKMGPDHTVLPIAVQTVDQTAPVFCNFSGGQCNDNRGYLHSWTSTFAECYPNAPAENLFFPHFPSWTIPLLPDKADDGCPDVISTLSARNYRVWCLSRSKNSEGYVYRSSGGYHPETVTCTGDYHRTPSGRCACAGGIGAIGLGCEFPPPNGTTWVDYILNHQSNGTRLCEDYGWALCSGHGLCVADDTQRLKFRCECGTGWFGTPGDSDSHTVYASEFASSCGAHQYMTHADSDRYHTRMVDVDQDLTDAIALHQCMWQKNMVSGTIRYDNSAVVRGTTVWNTEDLNAYPVLGPAKTYHPTKGSIDVMALRCTDARGVSGAPPNSREGSPGVLYGGINCEPCLPNNCSLDHGECLYSTHGVSLCVCFDRDNADPASGCSRNYCLNKCSSDRGHGRCPSEKPWDGKYHTYGVNDPVTRECECEAGYGGPDCSVALCPFAIDPHAPHSGAKMCGGHGTCKFHGSHTFLTAVDGLGNVVPGTTYCDCDDGWAAVASNRTAGGDAREDAGTCVFGTCPSYDGKECNGLTSERGVQGGTPRYTVCDNAPPSMAGETLARCQCFAAVATTYRITSDGVSGLYYGDKCQHKWLDACAAENEVASCTSSANGVCYECEEQLVGVVCPADTGIGPSCHCTKDPTTHLVKYTGNHCEVPTCGDCDATGGYCVSHEGVNVCKCNPNYKGRNCHTFMTTDAGETNECYLATDTEHKGALCSGFGVCVDCNDTANAHNPECGGTVRWACECPTNKAGRQCQVDATCGAGCEHGVCSTTLPGYEWVNISGPNDFVCTCRSFMSEVSYTGSSGNCGTDVCLSTNGTHAIDHDGAVSCDCPDGHVFVEHQGCRAACPHNPLGVECGVRHYDGTSRCNFGTSVCDCTTLGIPGSSSEMLATVDGYCRPYCEHCTQYQVSDPANPLASCLHPGSVVMCDDADKIDGVCQYEVTESDPCTQKRCKNGGVYNGTACVCSHAIYTAESNCASSTCGAHGRPASHDTTRCECDLPYLLDHNDHTKCVDGCAYGTANVTSGECENCPFTRSGIFCQTTICTHGELPDRSGCDCSHVPAYSGPLCNVSRCEHGGTPTADGSKCVCPAAWTGTLCDESACGTHGTPAADNTTCVCDAGYVTDESSAVACSQSRCGSQHIVPVPCNGLGQPDCVDGSYNYNCPCGSASHFTGGKCTPLGCVAANSHTVINSTGHFCECHPGYSGATCATWACAGHENNPKVFFDRATGQCACSIPWTGVEDGCSSHLCGVGYPVPDAENVRGTTGEAVLNATHYSPHAYMQTLANNGWDLSRELGDNSSAVFRVTRDMRWRCECPHSTMFKTGAGFTQDGYTLHSCEAKCDSSGSSATVNVDSVVSPCSCNAGYSGATCHVFAGVVQAKAKQSSMPVYAWVLVTIVALGATGGGAYVYKRRKAHGARSARLGISGVSDPGAGDYEEDPLVTGSSGDV